MKQYIQNAEIIRGDFEARMWSIANHELAMKKTPIIAIDAITEDGLPYYEICKYTKRPIYNERAPYEVIHTISEEEILRTANKDSESTEIVDIVTEYINKFCSKHCKRNKIFISEYAMKQMQG